MRELLRATAERAADHLEAQAGLPVRPQVAAEDVLRTFEGALPDGPADPGAVLDELVAGAAPGLMHIGSPRFFGWVMGGALPAALAADWMVTAWDQNAGGAHVAPAASAIEQVAGEWLLDVLGLPASAGYGFVTGCQMAHFTALAAARWSVLARAGWDLERDGLAGSPPIRVLAGEERHVTVGRALRLLGIGTAAVEDVAADDVGAMRPDALAEALGGGDGRPTIVVAQVGNINTGACDPMEDVCRVAREAGAWVHVDGAFGLWAAASPSRRSLVAGVERADSWATDAHKWLNVPYDCGIAIVADDTALRASMTASAAYIATAVGGPARDPLEFNPEFSRRARGVPVWAALRSLGRSGVAELVDRLCECADRFAERLAAEPGVEVPAHGLNQVLVRFDDDDAVTEAVVNGVQRDGTCFMSGTTWRGRHAMRISVSNWLTTFDEVDRSVEAVLAARHAVVAARA